MQWQGYARLNHAKTEYKGKMSNPRMSQSVMQAVLPCHLTIERIKMKQYVLLLKENLWK